MLPGAGITRIRFGRSGAHSPPSQPGPTELPCCPSTLAVCWGAHVAPSPAGCSERSSSGLSLLRRNLPPNGRWIWGLARDDEFWQFPDKQCGRGCSA